MLELFKNLLHLNVALSNKLKSAQVYDEALALYQAKEYKKALPLMREAAELGNYHAMTVYGTMFLMGQGVKENGAEAIIWLQRALELNEPNAASLLGMAYATGKAGVKRDLPKARALLTQAAQAGDAKSAQMLEMMDKKVGLFAKP